MNPTPNGRAVNSLPVVSGSKRNRTAIRPVTSPSICPEEGRTDRTAGTGGEGDNSSDEIALGKCPADDAEHDDDILESSPIWRSCLLDPVLFAEKIAGVRPHPGQARWLRQSVAPQNLLVTGNRWGKSYAAALKVLHRAIFQIRNQSYDAVGRYRIVCASITQEQAGIVWNEALSISRRAPILDALIGEVTRSPFPRITFHNGSVIEARSTQNRGEYLLGNDYDYFVFDEVAFEPHAGYVVDEVIMMRLADRCGMLDLISTPNGKNWFYRRFRELGDTPSKLSYVQSGDSRENPHISQDFISERLCQFSAHRVAQNIMGQFIDTGREIVGGEYINAALGAFKRSPSTAPPDTAPVRHISGWDLARKRTATVGVTIACDTSGVATVVALERLTECPWEITFEKIRARQKSFPGHLVIDGTGLGDVALVELRDLYPEGFIFTEKSKAELLTNLEMFHVRRQIVYFRWELAQANGGVWSLEDELRSARWDDNTSCDGVMALALALWPLRHGRQNSAINARVRGA